MIAQQYSPLLATIDTIDLYSANGGVRSNPLLPSDYLEAGRSKAVETGFGASVQRSTSTFDVQQQHDGTLSII